MIETYFDTANLLRVKFVWKQNFEWDKKVAKSFFLVVRESFVYDGFDLIGFYDLSWLVFDSDAWPIQVSNNKIDASKRFL